MVLDDLSTHRESDAGAFAGVLRPQPLKDTEDALMILGVDADAVVSDRNQPLASLAAPSDFDFGLSFERMVFDGVADQILEQAG